MHLIMGASGTVGSRVTRRLLERGAPVRAVSRDPGKISDLSSLGAEPIRGDLRELDWMAGALEGVTSVVLSTHGLVPPTRDNHPGITDAIGNRRLIEAAAGAGVDHIVFVSATSGANSPVLFGQVKHQVEQYLRSIGTVTHTIIRPTVFIETHGILLLAEPFRTSGSVTIFGGGTTTLNWISAEDVSECIVHALDDSGMRNRTVSIGGPDNLSRLEVLGIIEQMLGRTARRRHVPVAAMRLLKFLTGPLHPGMRYLLDMAVAESTMPGDPTWRLADFDWVGTTTVREVVERWADALMSPCP